MLNLHAILPQSRANGPSTRFVIWFQGCTLGCPQCFNPATHSAEPALSLSIEELIARIKTAEAQIEGVTISGGEPLQQATGLLRLLRQVRAGTRLSVILFSGFTRAEIERMAEGPEILTLVDVLIDGRYVDELRTARGLRGSANQNVHLLTGRYTLSEIERVPPGEIRVDRAGRVSITGVRPVVID